MNEAVGECTEITAKRRRPIKFQLLQQNDFPVLVYHNLNNSRVTLRVKYSAQLYVSYGGYEL